MVKTSEPRLHSVKFKSGGYLKPIQPERRNFCRIRLGDWGEITVRHFDDEPITRKDVMYSLQVAIKEIMVQDDVIFD